MAERPILMSAPMVRAILAGRKTQTRRAVKSPPPEFYPTQWFIGDKQVGVAWKKPGHLGDEFRLQRCPYGGTGDRLWVRENGWERPERTPRMMREGADTWEPYYFGADLGWSDHEQFKEWGFRRRPSIHMPRWACRFVLEVQDIRVERLFDISEADARAEGIFSVPFNTFPGNGWTSDEGQPVSTTARRAYEDLWYSINGSWSDVWVWVVAFRRVEAIKAAA